VKGVRNTFINGACSSIYFTVLISSLLISQTPKIENKEALSLTLGQALIHLLQPPIRDSLLESDGSGGGIVIKSSSFSANQRIQIRNCTLAGHRTGIDINIYSHDKNLTHPAPPIIIKKTSIIRRNNLNIIQCHDQRGVGLNLFSRDNCAQPSVLLKDVLFSSTVNCRWTTVLPFVQLLFAQNVTFVDCSFTGNRGTPIVAYSSHFNVSGRITFVNNTAYEGGALKFYGESFMSVHSNTEILFAGNYMLNMWVAQ